MVLKDLSETLAECLLCDVRTPRVGLSVVDLSKIYCLVGRSPIIGRFCVTYYV